MELITAVAKELINQLIVDAIRGEIVVADAGGNRYHLRFKQEEDRGYYQYCRVTPFASPSGQRIQIQIIVDKFELLPEPEEEKILRALGGE